MHPIELEKRRRTAGMKLADLARESQVPYQRLWNSLTGIQLRDEEIKRIERALGAAEAERTSD